MKNDPRALNALGVALYMTGDKAGGTALFRRAAQDGNAQAEENLRQAEAQAKSGREAKAAGLAGGDNTATQ